MATVTHVRRDDYGQARGARASIDGLGDVNISIGYGEPISVGSRFEVENIGTPANPSWQSVRSVQPLSPAPTIAEMWEDGQVGGYLAGDLLVGDILGENSNLFYSPYDGNLRLRVGLTDTITLYGNTGSARFAPESPTKPSLYWDAPASELSIGIGSEKFIRFAYNQSESRAEGYIDGRLAVTDVISNSLTDGWNQVGARGFWLGVESGWTRFRLGTYETGNHLYWNEETDELFISGTFEGSLSENVIIAASGVTIADNLGYYASGNVEGALQEIGNWGFSVGNGLSISQGGKLRLSPALGVVTADTTINVSASGMKVNRDVGYTWTQTHQFSGPDIQVRSSALHNGIDPFWSITDEGVGDFRELQVGRLYAEAFISDVNLALAGSQIITKSLSRMSRDLLVGGAATNGTLYVEPLPGFNNFQAFERGDKLRMRVVVRNTGILISDVIVTIRATGTIVATGDEHSYPITFNSGPAGVTVPAGTWVLDYGVSGDGFYHVTTLDPNAKAYAEVATWTTDPLNPTVHARFGHLGDIFADEWGLWAGPSQANKQYLVATGDRVEAHGISLRLYNDSGNNSVMLNPLTQALTVGTGAGYDAEMVSFNGTIYPGVYIGYDSSLSKYVFRVGNETDYVRWDGTELSISGVIKVKDGSDVSTQKYRVADTTFWNPPFVNSSTSDATYTRFLPGLSGVITNGVGEQFLIGNIPVVYTGESVTITKGYEDVIVYVLKDGSTIPNPDGGAEHPFYYGIDNPAYTLDANWVEMFYERVDSYFNNAIYTPAQRKNHVVIGRVRLSSDYSTVIGVFGAGETATTTIGPGYIKTDSLSAISANLGDITGGSMTGVSIELGTTQKLWMNTSGGGPLFAVGGSNKSSAPFRVYGDGQMYVGDGNSYLHYIPSTGLFVRGEIQATSGTFSGTVNASDGLLGSLGVTGELSITGASGQLTWLGGRGKLDRTGMYYREVNDGNNAAILRVGREGYSTGVIDVEMFADAASQWAFAFHVSDGGNNTHNVSALYRGYSDCPGTTAVDRIFDAKTANGELGTPYSDGFFSELAAGIWNESSKFDASGVSFKGKSLGGQAVAVFKQEGGLTTAAPVVLAGSDAQNKAVYYADISQLGQIAFHANNANPGGIGLNSFTALNANGGKIEMAMGDISNLGKLYFHTGASWSSAKTKAFTPSTPEVRAVIRVNIGGADFILFGYSDFYWNA